MKKVYSHEIASAINAFLKEDDWYYTFNEQTGKFTFGLNMQSRLRHVDYTIHVNEKSFTVHVYSPLNADKADSEGYHIMSDFLHRANYGLPNGNFELDDDGEIRYKTHVNCSGIIPSSEIIRDSIYMPAAMFNQYSPGILAILFQNKSALQAIRLCENDLLALLVEESGEEDMRDTEDYPFTSFEQESDEESGDLPETPLL